MQGNPVRLILCAAAFGAWLGLAGPALAQAEISPLDDPTGFWLVAETGPPVNQGLAAIPILGLAVRAQIGNPRAVWEIRREADAYTIEIPSRGLAFKGLKPAEGRLRGELPDATATPPGRVVLDVQIADGKLAGRLAFPNYAFDLAGRPPESVEALREALVAARGRLAELENPYSVPENERLRQENLVLIERIRRVESELRQRATAPARAAPAPEAAPPPRISVRGLVADLAATRAAALRAAPDANAPSVAQVGTGQTLIRLAEAPVAGWLLVADARGSVGYVQANQTAAAGAPVARAAREISISFPAWDAGRAGRRMTVPEPGFVSLVGRVRGDATLREVRIADAQTVSNPDGSFTSVVQVPREGRKVRVEALFAAGPSAVLEFEIGVGR